MQQIQARYNNIIIFLSFLLCFFHTFTFTQVYYSFIVTLALFLIIVILNVVKNQGKIVFNTRKSKSLLFLYVGVLLVILVGILIKGQQVIYMLGAYLPVVIWPTLYAIVSPIITQRDKRRYIFIFLILSLISIIATLKVVIVDNDAARLLAGAATDEIRYMYYRLGVGGYGFIYGSVFFIYAMLLYGREQKSYIIKLLIMGIAIIASIMIVFASYTTAVLFLLIILVLYFYARSSSEKATLFFIVAIIAIIVLINPILSILHDFSQKMDLYWISNRLGQLLTVEDTGVEGLRRIELYSKSVQAFISNPVLGTGDVGGHSMFFDTLGSYGMFGIAYLLSIIAWLRTLMKESYKRQGMIYILVMVLLTINTIDQIVFIPFTFFMVPIMISSAGDNSCESE